MQSDLLSPQHSFIRFTDISQERKPSTGPDQPLPWEPEGQTTCKFPNLRKPVQLKKPISFYSRIIFLDP